MDLDDDFEAVSPSQDPSTPPPERKLKRLKKSKPAVERSSVPETLDSVILATQDEPRSGYSSTSDDLEEETDWRSSSDPIRSAEDASSLGSKRALDFDSMPDQSDGIGGDKAEEADNIRPAIHEYDEEEKEMNIKKKKRRAEDVGDDDTVKPQRGRRQHLTQLRAETQRLLRETRDASFKPAPLVQKPISSVLEKIRRRKLEVSEKFVSRTRHTIEDEDGYSSDDVEIVIVPQNPSPERRDNKGVVELETEGLTFHENLDTCQADIVRDTAYHVVHEKIIQGSDKEPKQTFQAAIEETQEVGKEPKQTFRAPTGDTQDLFSDSQTSDSKDELADMTPDSSLEEVLAPSVLAMNLKLDSAPPDDISSDEEENDKENVSPESVDPSPVLDGDPAKAFVDDEAEEEDDSDNDLLRFQDDEDDDGSSEDSEELRDMIATQCDEKQSDIEKRMELHQKLLHQQDAAKTKNLMLRCGLKNSEKRFLMEDGDMEEVDEGEAEDYADDKAVDFDVAVKNHTVRVSIKKLQELIPRMFTDADDVYISSDDEEAEKRLATECLSMKAKNHTKLSSPAADARSSVLFTHIKKVNHIPENKRKAMPNIPDTLLMGGKSKTSSKPSFIGRGSNCSVPPSRRHGSNMTRSFIFEREESSSIKSTILAAAAAEDGSETIQRESQTSRTSRKLSSSQSKLNSQSREESKAESSSGGSSGIPLLEMLRRSSLRSTTSHCAQDASVACNNSIFAAFKLDKEKR